eukprot:CAMPEP_0172646584 /NCGR_PEP_ID=MMETSP1068-20121228/240316_1 /TAXON_ID=35684 /ORGANISM="Pseudopedinella elastica, Strain CCMP716" /LENGTH=378 /DNA_ID=CAMNT_0013460847 /DNA_START=213 /DNA_END=1349 /DNA_ORIENTATION=-
MVSCGPGDGLAKGQRRLMESGVSDALSHRLETSSKTELENTLKLVAEKLGEAAVSQFLEAAKGVVSTNTSSASNASTQPLSKRDQVLFSLPRVGMFVHIPKTGGSSIRDIMPSLYRKRFPWGNQFTNLSAGCDVRNASTFHLTLDEMVQCGLEPLPGPTLCVVRDPRQRFESEVRWRAETHFGRAGSQMKLAAPSKHIGIMITACEEARRSKNDAYNTWQLAAPSKHIGIMITACEEARRSKNDDTYAHCQPQSNYLYHAAASGSEAASHHPPQPLSGRSGDSDSRGRAAACDYLIADPSAHTPLMRAILGKAIPHSNKSNRKSPLHSWVVSSAEVEWLQEFYRRDYADPAIALAIQGKVLRRNGTGYAVINGIGTST